ncbi:MAG: LPS export ABC transporter ATP-binding protein [Proteobacteria bacterium]|nr:LPS export ABC transporter ATP-binding protein [Pseudomonadota bacterium]
MPRLEARSLTKSYRGRTVVKDVSIHLLPGEVVGLLGPNGAGKTTTFYMISGLVQPASGAVFLNGRDITKWPVFKRARVGLGYLPQEASIFRGMTVDDNLLAVMEAVRVKKPDRPVLLENLKESMGIGHLGGAMGGSLSGGERRRAEIARALVSKPAYLLLDEPFAGVDPITVQELQKLIRQLRQQGLGILITDHNVRETLGVTDRAYILAAGVILEEGDPDSILMSEKAREIYLGEGFRM